MTEKQEQANINEEMRFVNLDDEHDRVLFVWWD